MTKKLMLGAAISALMLSGAFAQAPNSPSPSSAPPAATKSAPPAATKSDQAKPAKSDAAKPMNAAEAKPADEAKIVMSQKPDQWLASNFKGTDVLGTDGKKIGDVSDILFDKHGKILAYVVSTGGFLGMGAKEVAFAPSAFTVQPGSNGKPDKLKLSMSQKELKQAQNFKPYEKPKPVTTGSSTHSPMSGGGSPLGGMNSPHH
jgi:PRC-barrel domain